MTLKTGSVDTFDEGRPSVYWPRRHGSQTTRQPVKRRLLRLSETVASYLTRELPSQRSPEAIRSISWRARVNLYLQPGRNFDRVAPQPTDNARAVRGYRDHDERDT